MKNALNPLLTEQEALASATRIIAELDQKKVSVPRQKALLQSFNTVFTSLSVDKKDKLRMGALQTVSQSPNANGPFNKGLGLLCKTASARPSSGFCKWYRNPVCAELI